jgi:hypothetical protein
MTPQQLALEHIRKCINTADALRMMSSAVLVRDLKILLKMAESAIQDQPAATGVRVKNDTSTLSAKTIVVEAP